MRHFESRKSIHITLLIALAYGAVACSSDTDHGPPVGAPNVPVVITEGGGSGGTGNIGQGAANSGGDPSTLNTAGSLNSVAGSGGSGFADPSAGSGNFGQPGTAGGTSQPPFNAGGAPFAAGGNGF